MEPPFTVMELTLVTVPSSARLPLTVSECAWPSRLPELAKVTVVAVSVVLAPRSTLS